VIKIAQLGLLLALVIGFSTHAKAALLVEPVVGYNFSKVDVENGKNYSSGTGPSFGGRLGYQNLGFQLGLDYLNSNINPNHNDFDSNVKMNEFAGFVGFEFPVLLRAYAGYIFSATGQSSNFDAHDGNGNQKLKLSGGSGMKVGLGLTFLPFVDINFEFRQGTFTDNKLGTTTFNNDVKYSSYMVGLSIPIAL
jgi:hypothetical protein